MAEKMIFVDEFFEGELRKFHEELKKIDKMGDKERDAYFKKLEKEEERLLKHYKRIAGEEEYEEMVKELDAIFTYQPPKDDENHEFMKRVMREMKFVRNADIKEFGLLWNVEAITDDVIVYTYDSPDVKQRKYLYIEEHGCELTCPWGKREINKKRKLYEQELGHWEYTEDDYKADVKNGKEYLKETRENPSDNQIIESVLMFALENGVINDDVTEEYGDKVLKYYNSLNPMEKKIIFADIDINVKTAAKLREDENISYADFRQMKRELTEKFKSTVLE